MKTIGIVAEYNPFHSGHLYQLESLRRKHGEDCAVVAVMSGDFVQRGDAAVYSKYARAEAAVCADVSLVLELPLPWCLSSAEGFARGGIGALFETGAVDAVSFGSESGDLAALRECAALLQDDRLGDELRTILKSGISFARAREMAVTRLGGENSAALLRTPNDTLGVEYLRAMERIGWAPEILPVKRIGSQHGGEGSASELRERLNRGENILSELPEKAAEVFQREDSQSRGPVLTSSLRTVWLSLLRSAPDEAFAKAPDTGEGLDRLLRAKASAGTSMDDIAMGCKSKRYALSRIRRALCCAALEITAEDSAGVPPYLRVLAMDEKGREVLHRMRKTAQCPVITKSAAIREQDDRAKRIFALGSRAHDLYVLGYTATREQVGGRDYAFTPYIRGLNG